MMKCLERYLGGDLYSLGARVIKLEGAPSSQSLPSLTSSRSLLVQTPNQAIESAPVGRPTRKSDALLLAAHRCR